MTRENIANSLRTISFYQTRARSYQAKVNIIKNTPILFVLPAIKTLADILGFLLAKCRHRMLIAQENYIFAVQFVTYSV